MRLIAVIADSSDVASSSADISASHARQRGEVRRCSKMATARRVRYDSSKDSAILGNGGRLAGEHHWVGDLVHAAVEGHATFRRPMFYRPAECRAGARA